MFPIEPGIPLPPAVGEKGYRKYPLADMKRSDSFFVPADGVPPKKLRARVVRAIRRFRAQEGRGYRFSYRVVKEHDAVGVRVWRTE
jgi:hypothetical protein